MTTSQIRCFLEAAKQRSFSKAASRLFISQPAVSKQIASLEADLGLTLIDRTPMGIGLTQAGELLYEFFQKSTTEFYDVLERAKRTSAGQNGLIRLGCLDGWDISAFFPELRGALREKYPELHISLNGYNHISIVDALQSGEIDIAITLGITLQHQRGLAVRNITSAPAALLFSKTNPLAKKESVRLEDFRDEPFFVIAPAAGGDNPMERLAVEVCKAAGFAPVIEHTPSSASVLMRLQGGTGAQITCAWTGACKLPLFRMVELEQPLDISAAWIENGRNLAKHVFVDELCQHYQAKTEQER